VRWSLVWRYLVAALLAFLVLRSVAFVPAKALVHLAHFGTFAAAFDAEAPSWALVAAPLSPSPAPRWRLAWSSA